MTDILRLLKPLALTLSLSLGIAGGANAQSGPDKVRFGLGWTDLGYFTPFFVAQQKGYYKENNLDVVLSHGSGASQSLARTGSGLFDMTVADSVVGLQAITAKVPVTMVGTHGAKSIITYFALDDSGIKTPKDLEGRILGGPQSDTGITLLPAFGKLAGFDASKVKVLNMDTGARVAALFQKRIDFLVSFDGGSLPILQTEARKQNRQPVVLYWRDYGFDALGMAIWANNDFLKSNPDVVRRFLNATYRGAQFMIAHPDEAADLYSSASAAMDKDITRSAAKSFAQTYNAPSQTQHGLGYIEPAALERTYKLAVDLLGMPQIPDLKVAYTNEYLGPKPVMPLK